jgi:hypothetical protein
MIPEAIDRTTPGHPGSQRTGIPARCGGDASGIVGRRSICERSVVVEAPLNFVRVCGDKAGQSFLVVVSRKPD